MKRVQLFSFGCKLNQAETQTLARELQKAGYQIVHDKDEPDIAIINSCTVTEDANKECLKLVRSLKRKHPHLTVVVTGCYAQLRPQELIEKGGADLVIGNQEKKNLLHHLTKLESNSPVKPSYFVSTEFDRDSFYLAHSGEGKTRAFLKIQDGCDYKCSFCTIPKARGPSRSASFYEIAQALRELREKHTQEIVLTGINLGDYRWKGYRFSDVVEFILESFPELPRLRLSSIEPNLVDQKLLQLFKMEKRLMPHLHLPLQSGNDAVLKRMRRRYLTKHYEEVVFQLKEARPEMAIGVDVIVGFPGETPEAFLSTYHFLEQLPVAYFHVFPYSVRPNTDAEKLPGHLSPEVKKARVSALRALSIKKQHEFASQFLNEVREVLVDKQMEGKAIFWGYTDNYLRVELHSPSLTLNQRVKVRLETIVSSDPLIVLGNVQEST